MRAAPPVQVVVGTRGAARALVAVLAGMAAAGCAAWAWGVWQWSGSPAARVASLAAFVLCGLSVWHRPGDDGGLLAWDGSTWAWRATPGELRVMIDVDDWMLLAIDPRHAGRRAWLPVSAAACGPAWHALRAAVYCRASTPPR